MASINVEFEDSQRERDSQPLCIQGDMSSTSRRNHSSAVAFHDDHRLFYRHS